MATKAAPDTVVLIHGLWMTPLSWEHWIKRYSDKGLKVIAPSWPGMEGPIEDLRRDPAGFAKLTVVQIVDHYDKIIRALPSPPIIMGHSFGGGFTQILVDRGLGAAGVPIDSAPVRGVFKLPLSTLRTSWPMLRNPIMPHKSIGLTPKQFHYAFCNTLTEEKSLAVWQRYAIPGPRGVLLEGANANLNPFTRMRVNFKNADRAPLLLIAGGSDHIVPASVNRENVKRYGQSKAVAELKEYPGRTHYTVGQDGWEEVADYAVDWAMKNARKQTTATASL